MKKTNKKLFVAVYDDGDVATDFFPTKEEVLERIEEDVEEHDKIVIYEAIPSYKIVKEKFKLVKI